MRLFAFHCKGTRGGGKEGKRAELAYFGFIALLRGDIRDFEKLVGAQASQKVKRLKGAAS